MNLGFSRTHNFVSYQLGQRSSSKNRDEAEDKQNKSETKEINIVLELD